MYENTSMIAKFIIRTCAQAWTMQCMWFEVQNTSCYHGVPPLQVHQVIHKSPSLCLTYCITNYSVMQIWDFRREVLFIEGNPSQHNIIVENTTCNNHFTLKFKASMVDESQRPKSSFHHSIAAFNCHPCSTVSFIKPSVLIVACHCLFKVESWLWCLHMLRLLKGEHQAEWSPDCCSLIA